VAAGATFGGSGSTDSLLAGGGLVSPGNSQGIVAVGQADPSGGLDFGFVLTSVGDPLWSNSAGSLNDVLRMTDATTPFTSALSLGNAVDVYFGVANLLGGNTFRGAFYTDLNSDFLASIASGEYNYWVLGDGAGTDATFEGQGYYSLSNYNANYYVVLSTVQVPTADFTSGDVNNGWVTQFAVQDVSAVPEPSTLALGLLSLIRLAAYAWRRKA